MSKVKTIKGVIGKLKQIADIDRDKIKGFDEMSHEQKQTLMFLIGEAYNFISELENTKGEFVGRITGERSGIL